MSDSNEVRQRYNFVERGDAEGLVWTFEDKETLKPTLKGYKLPKLGENEVQVKITYFGVSNKDIDLVRSEKHDVLAPGHQIVGIIESVGDKVGMRKSGDVVGVGFIKNSCKNCKICWNGK